jgi:hypothetical protein
MKVLKVLVSRDADDIEDDDRTAMPKDAGDIQLQLLCIVTAFELLAGQGVFIHQLMTHSI